MVVFVVVTSCRIGVSLGLSYTVPLVEITCNEVLNILVSILFSSGM